MKLMTLILSLLFASPLFAFDTSEIDNYLKKYSSSRQIAATDNEKGSDLLESTLKKSILKEDELSKQSIERILKLTVLLLKNDPHEESIEILHDFYKKRKNDFKDVLKGFDKKDQDLFNKALENYERELKEGNG